MYFKKAMIKGIIKKIMVGQLILALLISYIGAERGELVHAAAEFDVEFTAAELNENVNSFYQKVQGALNEAREHGTPEKPYAIHIPAGSYTLLGMLKVFSNTRLSLDEQAVVTSGGNDENQLFVMLTNGNYSGEKVEEDEYSGYGSYENITIEGGVWDGNASEFASGRPIMFRFAHARNIAVKDAVLQNNRGNHHVEAAAVDGLTFDRCTFKDAHSGGDDEVDRYIEAVQIDISSSDYPGFKTEAQEFDNCPCKNVLVNGCTFENVFRGVGSHHPDILPDGKIFYENIAIKNNTFINVSKENIIGWLWKNAVIENNNMGNSPKDCGISMQGCENSTISGNIMGTSEASGLSVNGGSVAAISANKVEASAYNGISVLKAEVGSIEGNILSANKLQGINLTDCKVTGNIANNILTKNTGTQITLNTTGANKTTSGDIIGNKITGGTYGVIVGKNCSSGNISGNSITAVSANAIAISSGNCRNIINNTINSPGKKGIAVTDSAVVVEIRSNKIENPAENGIGIDGKETRAKTLISNNLIKGRAHGITVTGGAVVTDTISANTVSSAEGNGIYTNSSVGKIEKNSISGTKKNGICTKDATINQISGNRTVGGKDGISCTGGAIGSVTGNTFSSASENGISVSNVKLLTELRGNTMDKPGRNGIIINSGTAKYVAANRISGAGKHGIFLNGATVEQVEGNGITGANNIGINIFGSRLSVLNRNAVSGAKEYGYKICHNSDVMATAANTGKDNKIPGMVSKDSKGLLYVNTLTTRVSLKDKVLLQSPYYSKENGEITYRVTDGNIASSAGSGKVKGLKKGASEVTAFQGGRMAAGGRVEVISAPQKVIVEKKKLTLKVGKKYTIKAKVNAGATCSSFKYTSSKKKVASVNAKGVIKAVRKGKAVITVKSYNGKKVKIRVTVRGK